MRAAKTARSDRTDQKRGDNLALVYQGILTGIVRIQSGPETIGDVSRFRRRMREALTDIERVALRTGYTREDVTAANYAIVAFLDEVVLSSSDPARSKWAPLQAEMFDIAVAGEGFFDRLKELQERQDDRAAEVLEVYFLCLLLGYRGRYGGLEFSDEKQTVANLKHHLERIRGSDTRFTPAALMSTPVASAVSDTTDDPVVRFRITAYVACTAAVLCWLFFKILLWMQADSVRDVLHRAIVP